MEWPIDKTGPRFKDFSKYEKIYVRTAGGVQSDNARVVACSDSHHRKEDEDQLWFSADLDFVDVLFCDSIAYKAVKHRARVRCQLLSKESLRAVAARSDSIKRDLDDREAERRAAAAKLEAERRAAQEIAISSILVRGGLHSLSVTSLGKESELPS